MKLKTEKEVLEGIVKKHIKQDVTLNVTESTTNWSLFNLFGDKKEKESKNYSVKIENQDVFTSKTNI